MAALPDLSENLINESQTWEEIREIKAMPVPMAQKRELKNQLQVGIVLFSTLLVLIYKKCRAPNHFSCQIVRNERKSHAEVNFNVPLMH